MNTVIPFALAIMLGSLGADLVRHYVGRWRRAAWYRFNGVQYPNTPAGHLKARLVNLLADVL